MPEDPAYVRAAVPSFDSRLVHRKSFLNRASYMHNPDGAKQTFQAWGHLQGALSVRRFNVGPFGDPNKQVGVVTKDQSHRVDRLVYRMASLSQQRGHEGQPGVIKLVWLLVQPWRTSVRREDGPDDGPQPGAPHPG